MTDVPSIMGGELKQPNQWGRRDGAKRGGSSDQKRGSKAVFVGCLEPAGEINDSKSHHRLFQSNLRLS